ncbi:MAG: hypothetical protein WD077_13740 [Bacteroidia bacterium]
MNYFRIFSQVLLAGIMGFTASCSKDNLSVAFSFNAADIHFTVDSTDQFGSFDVVKEDMPNNLNAMAEENGVDPSSVSSLTIERVVIAIEDPADANFDVVSSAEVFISTPTIEEVRIASKTDIEAGATSILLDVTDENLLNYFHEDVINVRVNLVTTAPVEKSVDMKTSIVFNSKGEVL